MAWHAWHGAYENADSYLVRRLRCVQDRIRSALDDAPPGPLRAISLCAGQGRDLIGVLADHPRGHDVSARLVELDERNVADAREAVAAAGLHQVEVVAGDAGLTNLYDGMVPADLVLICGVFGNLTPSDVDRLVDHCSQLCETGGTLVWTRNRKSPDLFPHISARLETHGFQPLWLSAPDFPHGVGSHRFTGKPEPLAPDTRMFTFVGYDVLDGRTEAGT
jgi:hypothetical protein